MQISGLDHIAIPVSDIDRTARFFGALGFAIADYRQSATNPASYLAILFGDQKIHAHGPDLWQNPSTSLRGPAASPGCGDLCFVWDGTVDELLEKLNDAQVPVEAGPVERRGGRDGGTAVGKSIYIRDPDENLLEFIVYPPQNSS